MIQRISFILLIVLMTSFTQSTSKKVLFFGDSITQMGINPGGYIKQIEQLAKEEKRDANFQFIGSGIGGNKVYDLYLRLEDDVLSQSPDVVFIYVGINDIWHKKGAGTGTDLDKFEKFYRALIKKLQEKNIRVVLCTPSVIGERKDGSNEQDKELDEYSSVIRRIANERSLSLVDLRKAFMDYYAANNAENAETGILTTDRVHLNDKGNKLVATEMWKLIKNF